MINTYICDVCNRKKSFHDIGWKGEFPHLVFNISKTSSYSGKNLMIEKKDICWDCLEKITEFALNLIGPREKE